MQKVFKKDAETVCSDEAAETSCLPGPGPQQLDRGHSWPGSGKNFSLLQIFWEVPGASCAFLWPQEGYRIATTLCCGHFGMVEQRLHLYRQLSLLPKPGRLGSEPAHITLPCNFTAIPQVQLDFILCALFQEGSALSPQTQHRSLLSSGWKVIHVSFN